MLQTALVEGAELDQVYERLRTAAEDFGMGWVLDELDEATALGVVEPKRLRPRTRSGRTTYEELTAAQRAGPERARAEEFVSRRPMTRMEQVDALLAALARVLVDLDDVASTAVEQLSDLPAAPAADADAPWAPRPTGPPTAGSPAVGPRVVEIDFRADEGGADSDVTTEGIRHDRSRRDSVRTALARISEAVRE